MRNSFKYFIFILVFIYSCQHEPINVESVPYADYVPLKDVEAKGWGKVFVKLLKDKENGEAEWKEMFKYGKPLMNHIQAGFYGEWGNYIIIPIYQNKKVEQFAVYTYDKKDSVFYLKDEIKISNEDYKHNIGVLLKALYKKDFDSYNIEMGNWRDAIPKIKTVETRAYSSYELEYYRNYAIQYGMDDRNIEVNDTAYINAIHPDMIRKIIQKAFHNRFPPYNTKSNFRLNFRDSYISYFIGRIDGDRNSQLDLIHLNIHADLFFNDVEVEFNDYEMKVGFSFNFMFLSDGVRVINGMRDDGISEGGSGGGGGAPGGGGGSGGSGGSTGGGREDRNDPNYEALDSIDYNVNKIIHQIFVNYKNMDQILHEKLKLVVKNMYKDCLGKKLLKHVSGKNLSLVYNPNLGKGIHGAYNHNSRTIYIRDFNLSNKVDRLFETTLLHELFHAAQDHSKNNSLNREVEAFIAMYLYMSRNEVKQGFPTAFSYIINRGHDKEYVYSEVSEKYDEMLGSLRVRPSYRNMNEMPSERNINLLKDLSQNCK